MRRLLIVILAASAALPATASAQVSPPGCGANNFNLDFVANRATARPGQTVDYTVRGSNLGMGACDVTLNSATFTPPTGAATAFTPLPPMTAGTNLTTFGTRAWTADGPPRTVSAKVAVTGTLYDAAAPHAFSIDKTLGLTIVEPKIAIAITADPANGPAPLPVTFHYRLSNLSSPAGDLTFKQLTHPLCSPAAYASGDANLDGKINPAEVWDYTCTKTFDWNTYSSTAAVTATSALDGGDVSAVSPTMTFTASKPPSTARLSLTKTASPTSGFAPLSVRFTYTVANTGPSTPIADVTVQDGACAPVTTTAANDLLQPGGSRTFTCDSVLGIGSPLGSAIASGTDTITKDLVASDSAFASVTVSSAPDPQPLPDPGTGTPKPTPTPTPTTKPSKNVTFAYTGRFTPARSCRGTVALSLKAGTKTLATKRVKLDSKCRYKVSFTVTRTRLGKATKVTIRAKQALRSASRTLPVPKP